MANTYKKLTSYTVPNDSASFVTFSNVSQDYTDLVLRITSRTARVDTLGFLYFTFSEANANYSEKYIYTDGASFIGNTGGPNSTLGGAGVTFTNASTATADSQGVAEMYIPNYTVSTATASNYKIVHLRSSQINGGSANYTMAEQGWSENYGAITSITVGSSIGNLLTGTQIDIYGIWATSSATLPSTPTIGTATAGNAQASITFTPTSASGVDASYTALSSPGSITATGTSSPITVTGLTNDTAYTFQVKANNPGGSSAYSSASNSVTPVDPAAFVSIATATPNGTSTVTFSSIPQTYKALVIKSFARDAYSGGVVAGAPIYLRMNSDTVGFYTYKGFLGYGTTASVYGTGTTNSYFLLDNACALGSTTANTFGVSEIQIQDYTSTVKYKPITAHWGVENNTSSNNFEVGNTAGAHLSTAAITSLTIFCDYNFVTGTSIALYGVK